MLDYTILEDSVRLQDGVLLGRIKETHTNTFYILELRRYAGNIVRVYINEENPPSKRYRVQDTLLDTIQEVGFGSYDPVQKVLQLDEQHKVKINLEDVRLDFYVKDQLAISANNRGLFYFEHLREKEEKKEDVAAEPVVFDANGETAPIDPVDLGSVKKPGLQINMDKAWEQSFGGSTDKMKKGPQSVGMDISFSTSHIYGLPEHTTKFELQSTTGPNALYSEPYRLYNLDVFEYEIDTPMALYGSIPWVMAHQNNLTTGVLWLNSAETWIDVERPSTSGGLLDSFFGTSSTGPLPVSTHWFSESGVIDTFFMFGPRPKDVWRQLASLVGSQDLPPVFSIGYHQCRWNYNDQKDVADVNSKFEELDIPYDVIWLDIEHTNGKRYFTWDNRHFATPVDMIKGISQYGRKMVTIVDPHIKRDSGYHIHSKAEQDKVYIKDENEKDYEGFCWPGSSSWIDYTSAEIRDWWAEKFNYNNYPSTPDLYTWNDMNEPSVFSGPEVTMEKTALHYDGTEHRDIHNLYGTLMHRATASGLTLRNENKNKRPFVLSRAFFAGSQRWGAIWTGDNTAEWSHLAIAQPMLLSMGISGLSFVGSDVGGFFGNPSPELLLRWYQVGAYHPFFRAHAHHDTKRREPWVHGEPWTTRYRAAIISRYAILPYLYTVFYEAYRTGTPILRPLWAEFPGDEESFGEENAFLLGNALLIKPVTEEGVTTTTIRLPGDSVQAWYDAENYQSYSGSQTITVDTPLEKIAVFQRGGTIVPRKLRVRRSSSQMANDPITLVIALDHNQNAQGEIYIDDGDSFEFKEGKYVHRILSYTKENEGGNTYILSSSRLDPSKFQVPNRVERLIVMGLSQRPSSITMGGTSLSFDYNQQVLIVKNPNVILSHNWSINFKF